MSTRPIDPATQTTPSVASGLHIHVGLDAASWGNAPVGTEVKVRIFVAHEANRPEGHDTRLIVTITKSCEGTPTETPTPTGSITPTAPTGTPPATDCTGANPHPTGTKLAERYGVPYDEIMGWFCQHFGFGEIDHAYSLSRQFGVPVADIFALRRSGMGWGEIRKYLENLPTGTPGTGTPGTGTWHWHPFDLTGSGTPQPSGAPATCTGANPHPTGQRLALRYGVPYAEIMGWFCQGFGFGEIDLAYSLSLQSGTPVPQIFDMRRSGMGWGEIRHALLGGPGNGNSKGNGNNIE
jgi:hypothetical protein